MAIKRPADPISHGYENEGNKKVRKGFSVGSANLPDGTHRRKGEFS